MANTINLGAYPTGEGTTTEEKSIYIGNNRFVRLLTQSNPDRTIAVLSESSDVFSGTQTLTNVHEQVVINNDKITKFKLEALDNGDVVIVGDKDSRSGNLNTVITLRFNDTSGQFEILSDHDIGLNNNITNTIGFIFKVYDNDKIFIAADTAGYMRFFSIKGLSTGTISSIDMYNSTTTAAYFVQASSYIKLIGSKLFCSISSEYQYQGHLFDMDNETAIYNNSYYMDSGEQLDTDRFITIKFDNSGYVYYKLDDTQISNNSSTSMLSPKFDIGLNNDDNRIRDIVPLDRQHFIYFIRYENGSSVYAKFIKVIDENYGFVSDNSSSGNGIFVCNITTNNSNINGYHNGRLVHPISGTQFWIQTNTNEFTFLTMSTS